MIPGGFAAGLAGARDHALISLLALNGLRVSEAIGARIEDLALERGHRTLTVLRKGGKTVTMPLAPRTARAIEKALQPEGFQIMQLNGEAGGQTVFHLHFHIVPRWADRPMKGHGHAPMAETAALQALAGKIAAELQ